MTKKSTLGVRSQRVMQRAAGVAAALCLAVLAGCSSSATSPPRDAASETASADAPDGAHSDKTTGCADATCATDGDAAGETASADAADAADGTPAAATISCGDATCAADEICERVLSGLDGGPTSFVCEKLPPSCAGRPACQCACGGDAGLCNQMSDRFFTCNGV